MTNDSKHIQASLSLISTDWLHLQVVQMPRSRDLAIFIVQQTNRWTDVQIDYFTPAHAHGVLIIMVTLKDTICIQLTQLSMHAGDAELKFPVSKSSLKFL